MRISELIKQLEMIKETEGDLIVGTYQYDGNDDGWEAVRYVAIGLGKERTVSII